MAARPKQNKFGNVVWLDFSLNERAEIRLSYEAGSADISALVLLCLDRGIKISLSFRPDIDVYLVSITFKHVAGQYKGKTYVIQHVELDVALTAATFAIEVMFEAGSLPVDKKDQTPSW